MILSIKDLNMPNKEWQFPMQLVLLANNKCKVYGFDQEENPYMMYLGSYDCKEIIEE